MTFIGRFKSGMKSGATIRAAGKQGVANWSSSGVKVEVTELMAADGAADSQQLSEGVMVRGGRKRADESLC